jgi:hypothetical protein
MTDGSMRSRIHITNNLVISSLSVTPVLWLANGTRLPLPPIDLQPSGTAIVSVNQALTDQDIARTRRSLVMSSWITSGPGTPCALLLSMRIWLTV